MTTIKLPFPPSTNNLFINGTRGRFRSQKYEDWIAEAGWELARQRPPKFVGPVCLMFYFQDNKDKRKRDITNLLKAPEDLLVKHRVIEADDGTIVKGISAHWVEGIEGVEIYISPVTNRVPEETKGDAEAA